MSLLNRSGVYRSDGVLTCDGEGYIFIYYIYTHAYTHINVYVHILNFRNNEIIS